MQRKGTIHQSEGRIREEKIGGKTGKKETPKERKKRREGQAFFLMREMEGKYIKWLARGNSRI